MTDETFCDACGGKVDEGELVYTSCVDGAYLGVIHAACMGYPEDTDADGFVDQDGEPLDERPDPYPFGRCDPAPGDAANAVQTWIAAHLARASADRRQKELW